MSDHPLLTDIFLVSEDVVIREIEGEIIIVPLASGIGDMEDELYSLNETGRDILRLIDGKLSLDQIVVELTNEYEAPLGEIEKDVLGLVHELEKRKFLIRVDRHQVSR